MSSVDKKKSTKMEATKRFLIIFLTLISIQSASAIPEQERWPKSSPMNQTEQVLVENLAKITFNLVDKSGSLYQMSTSKLDQRFENISNPSVLEKLKSLGQILSQELKAVEAGKRMGRLENPDRLTELELDDKLHKDKQTSLLALDILDSTDKFRYSRQTSSN